VSRGRASSRMLATLNNLAQGGGDARARGPIQPSPVATNACHAKPQLFLGAAPPPSGMATIFDMDSRSGRDRAPRSSTPANNQEATLAMAAGAIPRRGPEKKGKSKTEKPDLSAGRECAANRRGAVSKNEGLSSRVIRAKTVPSHQHEFIPCIELAYRPQMTIPGVAFPFVD
jgi:hypothetical protein